MARPSSVPPGDAVSVWRVPPVGDLANAYTRAYNRYIVDFCSHDRSRLVPVAHLSLIDIDGAIE
ncbi:MAG: hypothetical protein OEY23_18705, partial [Acidimicrobiia bacterium]|nr:hypothetical protein [Acidimicrobiia bacterium]